MTATMNIKNAYQGEKNTMQTVIIYARVSTLTQKQDETINSQLKRLKAYCRDHNLTVVDVYKDDRITGASEERIVNLVKYLQDTHKSIDCLVCTCFDRVARDTYLQLWLDKECQKLDIEIISTEQDLFNNTRQDPLQEAMQEMMYVFAKLEKNIIAKRLKGGRAHKATVRGIKSQGNCPLGYEYEGKTTKGRFLIHAQRHGRPGRSMPWDTPQNEGEHFLDKRFKRYYKMTSTLG
jgi:site-specific DNA recombinase